MSVFNVDDILSQFKSEQAKATAAQAAQMAKLIQTIQGLGKQTGGTFDDALSRIEGLGDTARERTTRTGQRTLAAGQSDLISSGLSNTTNAPNLRRVVAEDTEFAQQGIDEQVGAAQSNILQNRAGNETQIGGLLANAIGGQNIQGPDLGFFAQLLQQASAAGDPNQKTNAFAGVNSASLNAPNSAFQRPGGGGGGGGGSPGASSFGVTQPGAPSGTASIKTRASEGLGAALPSGGVFGAEGQAISPIAQAAGKRKKQLFGIIQANQGIKFDPRIHRRA